MVWYRRIAVQRRLRLVARLAGMRPHEIVHRLGKKAAKYAARRRGGAPELADAARPLPAVLTHPTAHLLERTAPSGFFALAERAERAATCRRAVPGDVARTLAEAAALLGRDGLVLLGRRFQPSDAAFDWLADPGRGRLWPLVALDDNDVVRGVDADVKLVWEVNRHQFLVTLARASIYGGDPEPARAAVAMLRSWLAANPPGVGVNWSSNLEVAIRMTSWVWTLHYLVGTPALADDVAREWLTSLRTHRDYVARHLSIYTDATNHLIGEAAALAIVSLWLPELDDAERWLATALAILARELERQVAPDGVGREQATSYQRYVLDWVLQVVWLADRNRVALPAVVRERTRDMLAALAELQGPRGRAPRIGDSDQARGIPFFTEDYWCFDEILALGAAVLGGSPATLHESVVWMTGAHGRPPDAAPDPGRRSSRLFREGGYAILRTRPPALEARLVFDCGPLGYPPHASHGHADLLSVLVDVGGEEILIDPGTYAYWDPRGRRDLFRATRSHNTIEVGGHDQADGFDPFMWLNFPRHGVGTASLGGAVEYVDAWHDGYRRLRSRVRHRRGVLALPGGWLVIDWLDGRGRQRWTRWFHAAPGATIDTPTRGEARVWSANRRAGLWIHDCVTAAAASDTALRVGVAPYSERYGEEQAAPVVALEDAAELPAVRVTALWPVSADRPEPALRPAATDAGTRAPNVAIRLLDAGDTAWDVAIRRDGFGHAAEPRVAVRADGRPVDVT